MKRIILSSIFLIIFSLFSNSQTKNFKALYINVFSDGAKSGWIDSNVIVNWKLSESKIYIDSNEQQIIEYTYEKTLVEKDFKNYYFKGKDKHNNKISILFSVCNSGEYFLTIYHTDYYYSYFLMLLEDNEESKQL